MTTAPDLREAARFLSILDESADGFCFRVFDDDQERADFRRARKLNGEIDKLGTILARANDDRCGVFVAVNEGGQDAASIRRVRAVFADTDGAPLDPLLSCGLEPHVVVETSPGKWHVYWLVEGLPLDQFAGVQRRIAAEFGTDPSVIDLPRVMRLPGFAHQKASPHLARIVHESGAQPYDADRILARFPPSTAAATGFAPPALGEVVNINRHASILKETRFLAHDVASGHMTRGEALALMRNRVATGRYTRDVPDEEITRALDGALRLSRAQPAPDTTPRPDPVDNRWGFVFADEMLASLGPTRWLVQKLIPEDCTGVLYGPSGSLKSFVMIDMALAIASGTPWQGKPTKPRSVFYLAGEGEQGFAKRIAAWCADRAIAPPKAFAFRQIPRLQDASDLERLVSVIHGIAEERGQAGLIVIDTLFTALDGGDENSGKDMGQMIAAMKRLRVEFKAATFAVHHTGKQGETARGHSSLPSGMDVMLYAKPGPVPLSVEITNPKQKDGAEHPALLLQASVHQLPIVGEDGEHETSLVLSNPAGDVIAAFKARTKVTDETVAKAQSEEAARVEIMRASGLLADSGASIREIEQKERELSQELGFPHLARSKSTIGRWLAGWK